MSFVRTILVLLVVLLFAPHDALAQRLGVGLRAGTHGPGFELASPITGKLNARLGLGYLPYSLKDTHIEDDFTVDYSLDASVQTASALVDFHPFGGTFRLTTGLMYNGTNAKMMVLSTEDLQVGNRTFSAEEIGTLEGVFDYGSKVAPYAGLGLGNPVSSGGRLTVMFDLGVMYSGAPRFKASGTGMIGPSAEQDALITEAFETFVLYPVLSLGLAFRLSR
jgi:hypothetical protein